jgi:predicted PilT family ATPase
VKKASKKPTVTCKIVGRKEAVEEAKQRLEAQIERLADETTEVISIKRALHPALIGSSGKYAIRLEEKYGVKITFPRDAKDGVEQKSTQKPDEVILRGGKKGVAGAKAELLEAAEFEKENNQSSTFTVPTAAVARILGKAGANINAIKDDTGAQIDVDKTSDKETSITVKGDKHAIAAAKASIQSIVAEVGDRKEDTITIPSKFVSRPFAFSPRCSCLGPFAAWSTHRPWRSAFARVDRPNGWPGRPKPASWSYQFVSPLRCC